MGKVLKLDDYKDIQGVIEKIRHIDKTYYLPAAGNIIYLEKNTKEYSVIYMIALRDAQAHLDKILEYSNSENSFTDDDTRTLITRHLERYLGHMEELLYDTYLRIINEKIKYSFKRLRKKEREEVRMKITAEYQNVRTMSDDITIEQKIENFEKIIEFLEKV